MLISTIPLDIKNFITETIESVSYLEVLLMLYAQPEREWDEFSLSKEMRTNTSFALKLLQKLKEKKLLSLENNKYRYAPQTPELHQKVVDLEHLYREKPVAIVACIFEKPDKLKSLSDAFKIKKD